MAHFPTSLVDRISAETFEFTLRGWKEPAAQFFAPTPTRDEILAERRRWLTECPQRCLVYTPDALDLAQEAQSLAHSWNPSFPVAPTSGLPGILYSLGLHWEVDFILCCPDPGGKFRMDAGVVCFPSYWSPEEKVGLPVEQVHAPVPGLNAVLGPKIENLLGRLPPGKAWMRLNWGLSASAERNQHPLRGLPHLEATTPIEGIWLRLEHQALVRLPVTSGVLFGIQLYSLPLVDLRHKPAVAQALAGQLRSMADEMQVYKGIQHTASRVAGWLEKPS